LEIAYDNWESMPEKYQIYKLLLVLLLIAFQLKDYIVTVTTIFCMPEPANVSRQVLP
jgi:hypothetical protein